MSEVITQSRKNSTIEPTVNRKDATIAVVGSLIFIGLVLLHKPLSTVDYLVVAVCFLFCLVFVTALVFPDRFRRGIRLIDGGFEHVSPLKGSHVVFFGDINRIDAVCRGDGECGDDIPFLVHTESRKVLVLERDLFTTGLLDEFKGMRGFDSGMYSEAARYEVKGLDPIFGKKFVVYERT